jgi:hypothetical protein
VNLRNLNITLEEEERQATLLALAILCLQRPGWDDMLGRIADKLHGREMWESFKLLNEDKVWPFSREPSTTCPICGLVSFNPNDIEHRYCGHCHKFHADMVKS